jgi:hypothetical protein
MKKIPTADKFFDTVDYVSIIDTVKGIFTSDGSMSLLLDYERVLDEADLYAFKNWELGELVQGPTSKRYSVGCIFLWPYKLMPDPRGAKRLVKIGCKVRFKLTKIRVPVIVKDYDDFVPGTRYPKMDWRKVWLVSIEIPRELMDDIKEGSIDLAGQTIDLQDLADSYDDDLQKEDSDGTEDGGQNEQQTPGMADLGAAPLGAPPAI